MIEELEHFTPACWRQRAEEARAVAAQFTDLDANRVMKGIADSYDEMASTTERIDRSNIVLGKTQARQ
jgi:hypothetical protein